MRDNDGGRGSQPVGEVGLPDVAERITELQRRKRKTVRWHMSRDTAERAIAAITEGPERFHAGKGKARRRKRHKRLL